MFKPHSTLLVLVLLLFVPILILSGCVVINEATPTSSSIPTPTTSEMIIRQDNFHIGSLDDRGMEAKYGHITNAPADLPSLPFNEFGVYAGQPFYLEAGEAVTLTVKADYPIYIDKYDLDSYPTQGKLWVMIAHRDAREIDTACFSTSDNLHRVGERWENSTEFVPNESGLYVFMATTQYCEASNVSYVVSLKS